MENKVNSKSIWLRDSIFPLLVGLACAGIFAGTHMYIVHHTGIFNEIFVVQMLDKGLKTGDYASAAGFAAGFLFARVLEGPLVGILDIGGALLTGVGVGVPALMLASGIDMPIKSFPLALLTGLVIGVAIGGLIILIRKLLPNGVEAAGTGIMMGAGNATGRYLGPLIILSAIQYGIPTGIGALIGGALFYKYDRPIAGGAIIGAMIAGGLFL